MTDPTELLFNSTANLHTRFDLMPPDTDAVLRVMFEEVYEFTREVTRGDVYISPEFAVSEACDVMVTVLAALISIGVDYAMIAAACERVAAKNDAKTTETHEINSAGKIARKVAQS